MTLAETTSARLCDICSRTFLFLTSFCKTYPDVSLTEEWVRERILEIFHEQEKLAENLGLRELYEKAKYLLVVTADGVILNTEWASANTWSLLELDLYGTADGGEKFFEYLRKDPSYNKEDQLQEIFYLCLCAGFRGMYIDSSEELEEIRQSIYRKLRGVPATTGELVTPQAYEGTIETEVGSMPIVKTAYLAAMFVGALLFLVALVYVTYTLGIDKLIERAAAMANGEFSTVANEAASEGGGD